MTLQAPFWIVLLPAFLALAWRYPQLQLTKPLRALLVLLLIALLIEPRIKLGSEGLDLWVLVDRSASTKSTLDSKLREWEKLLNTTKGRNDRLQFVDFADVAVIRGEGDVNYFDTARDETRIPLAVRTALSKRDPQRDSRLLVFTDGYTTEPLLPLSDLLAKEGLALDYRLSGTESSSDFRVERVNSPNRVQGDESFLLEITISGTDDIAVPVKLFRDDLPLVTTTVDLHNHRGVLRLSDQLSGLPRAYRYTARIDPPNDQFPGNNWGEVWVEVQGPRSVLVVSGYDNEPLRQVLSRSGIDAVVSTDPGTLSQGDLSGRSVVVLDNIPAHRVSRDFVKALPFFVQSQGGGLLMIGGKSSFGSGGWFQSDIDPLLPVSMELREEERRVSTAMAVILDRSGSMGAHVEGNMGNMQKMDLANEGGARTISLLGSSDMVSIIAVDSEPHNVVPLSTISGNREEMMSKARSVTVGGGGIFVYTGLKAAWEELKNVKKLQRHIVLFADAADAEEEGEYKALLKEITAAQVTVSVIGLGTDHDTDAEFLKDVAKRGNGRVFFVSNAVDLPSVFAQETVSVARSTFITDPTPVAGTPAWREISQFPIEWLSGIDGYNLNYVRPNARAPLISKDEYKAPIVAAWQRGIGRTAAISAPIAGEYSEKFRTWPGHGDLLQTLLGWLRGPELPPGIGIKTRVEGTTLFADLYYEKSWEEKISTWSPVLIISGSSDTEPKKIGWERIGPGHFRATKELQSSEVLRGVVQIGDTGLPFGPVALGRSAEWDFDRNKVIELQNIAQVSGGTDRVNLADVWHAPRRAQIVSLFKPLLILFLLLFLLEALLTRLGRDFSWPEFSFAALQLKISQDWKRRKLSKPSRIPASPTNGPASAASTPSTDTGIKLKDGEPNTEGEARQSMFDKAKRGGL